MLEQTDIGLAWRDRTVMVTGASGGLGRLIAAELGRAGARVAVVGRNHDRVAGTAELVTSNGGQALPLLCDVSDVNAVEAAVARTQAVLGPIELLVNNAGEHGPIESIQNVDPTAWWRTFESNLLGTFLCTQAVLPTMSAARQGMIVNIASHAGVFRWPFCSAYSVSKAAVIKFTENLGQETLRQRIAAFAYHPGLLSIGLAETLVASGASADTPEGKVLSWFRAQESGGLLVDANRSVQVLMRLISGRYNRLTGCYMTVEDDLDAMLHRIEQRDMAADPFRLRLSA